VPLSTSEEVPKLLSEAATIARQGYQWRIGVGFLDSAQQRESIALLASKGMLRAVILYVQGRPVSYWICKQYGRGLHLDYTGYDPSFGRYEPGTLALFWIMDQACQEGLDFIDMGGGQYEYMRKFSNSQFVDCTHLVFAASRRGILLNALRIVTLGPIELIRHMTEVFGMESQVREMWRKYPSQGGQKRKLREIPKPNHQRIVSNLPGQTRRGIPQKLWRWTFLVLLVSVTYLSWKPSPSIAQVSWIPAALGRWFDQHDFSKNVIGYGVFALTGFAAWSRPMHLPADQPSNYLIHSLVLLACFCATVAVLELGQLALSHRTCDWADILAGWTGIVLVWAIFQVGQFIFGGRN
jgi:hypothetical protein